MNCDYERNSFTDPESVFSCLELLEAPIDRALQSDYSPWESTDVDRYEKNRSELEKSSKAVRLANVLESSSSLSKPSFVFEKMPSQLRRPAQPPSADIGKTHRSGMADLLAGNLRSNRKASAAALS